MHLTMSSCNSALAPISPLDIPQVFRHSHVVIPQEEVVEATKSDVLQGTLDLMVLKTLDAMGPLHGYGIARRLEQISDEVLKLNQGTVYASLVRLVQRGWIKSVWAASEHNRKAKYYSITARGRKQLQAEAENWARISGVIGRLLELPAR